MRAIDMKASLMMANALYTLAAANGGASLNRNFEAPLTGYMVEVDSIETYENLATVNVHELSMRIQELSDGLDAVMSLSEGSNYYFGSWRDKDGSIHFGLSLAMPTEEAARKLGVLYEQKAIWDVEEGREIRL